MNKVICVQCREYVDYDIKDIEQKTTIKNQEIVYKEKVAYCKKCGKEVWVEELEEENVLTPINIYCEQKGLISSRQINQLLEKYNIGKRPLAKLLGWGEITVARFLEGQLPSKEYSNRLIELMNNPNAFKSLLIKQKGKITESAFKKALNAVSAIVDENITTTKVGVYRWNVNNKYIFNLNQKEIIGVKTPWSKANCYC